MSMFDKIDFRRIAISTIGALMLATLSVAGVAAATAGPAPVASR